MPALVHRPPEARCEVLTFKEGLLSRMAHDLLVEVGEFEVQIAEDGTISATFEAASLRCKHALKKGAPAPRALSDRDRRTIDASIQDEVLGAGRMPTIDFQGQVTPGETTAQVEGTLTLHGVERRLRFEARRQGASWQAEIELHQPDFGIRPFTALMGSLKIKPVIEIRIILPAK